MYPNFRLSFLVTKSNHDDNTQNVTIPPPDYSTGDYYNRLQCDPSTFILPYPNGTANNLCPSPYEIQAQNNIPLLMRYSSNPGKSLIGQNLATPPVQPNILNGMGINPYTLQPAADSSNLANGNLPTDNGMQNHVVVSSGNSIQNALADIEVFTDATLKELKPSMIRSVNCSVKTYDNITVEVFRKMLLTWPEDSRIQAVVLHLGFQDSKFGPKKGIEYLWRALLTTVDEKFPNATVFVSAVLPCRRNKNSQNIENFNRVTERLCNETLAKFIDLTPMLIRGTILPDEMYLQSTVLSETGAQKFAEGLSSILNPQVIGTFFMGQELPNVPSSASNPSQNSTPSNGTHTSGFYDHDDIDLNQNIDMYNTFQGGNGIQNHSSNTMSNPSGQNLPNLVQDAVSSHGVLNNASSDQVGIQNLSGTNAAELSNETLNALTKELDETRKAKEAIARELENEKIRNEILFELEKLKDDKPYYSCIIS